MFICLCQAVTDRDIRQAIAEGNKSTAKIVKATNASTQCGRCLDDIIQLLEKHKINHFEDISAVRSMTLSNNIIGTPELYGI